MTDTRPKVETDNRLSMDRLAVSLAARAAGEDDPRIVLPLLIETALGPDPASQGPVPADPATCPNCDKPCPSERSPYCGTGCREMAGFIRQFRGCLLDGSVFNEERLAGLGQAFWHVLGGGYPARLTLIPEKARERVFARTGGQCEVCGAPAATLDHIGSACNRPINLRPVCESCTRTKRFLDDEFLRRQEVASKLDEIAQRIGSKEPIRCCDDPTRWDWRAYLAERKCGG